LSTDWRAFFDLAEIAFCRMGSTARFVAAQGGAKLARVKAFSRAIPHICSVRVHGAPCSRDRAKKYGSEASSRE